MDIRTSPTRALAQKLSDACDHYLAHYRECLPRVAKRHMDPVLEAASKLFEGEDEHVVFPIFKYFVNSSGVRAEDGIAYVILYCATHKHFIRVMGLPENLSKAELTALMLLGPGGREVTIEDLVELGIQPTEIVEYMQKSVQSLLSDTPFFTQAPAQA